ncbi:hypothetical protein GCM10025771_29110 [Niveibacterium umoris]|uniref:Sulfotransferase family protein n=1 Tax=Niveibacterium umoris TaxID=1193620 RepID=A0A840BLY6_9RHOO|nr:sulfotransferase domain-containing protein [Niveibacterium umoris]MBB4011896.1 hypothetical protein [Niveibacterium umoris]
MRTLDIQPLVVGTPRSGFSLLIAMIQRIMDYRKVSFARTPQQEAITRLMPLFSYALNKSYEDVFVAHGLGERLLYNGEFQLLVGGPKWLVPGEPWMGVRKYIGCLGHADFLLVTKHPRILFDYHGVRHSHDAPQRWAEDPGFSACHRFATIRHPLDMFNSAVHSINALASEYLQRFRPGADESALRREIALNKLSDPRICKGLMSHQLKYWKEYLPCRPRYAELRWEDVIADPVASLQWVATQLGLELSATEAEAVWKPMDHRNLLVYHQHNYRKGHGIVGDWLTHLRPAHVRMAREMGLLEVAETLGYSLDDWSEDAPANEFQQVLDDCLNRGEVFPMTDPELAGFCFNKSNIDASAFNFKSFAGRKWAYVERSTLSDDAIVQAVLERAEEGCEAVNAIALQIEASPGGSVEKILSQVADACAGLVRDDAGQALLDQALMTDGARNGNLLNALQGMSPGSIIWGLGKDLLQLRAQNEAGFDALLRQKAARLADAALAGRSFAGLEVKRFEDCVTDQMPDVVMTPFSAQTRIQMRRSAAARCPQARIIDPYRTASAEH